MPQDLGRVKRRTRTGKTIIQCDVFFGCELLHLSRHVFRCRPGDGLGRRGFPPGEHVEQCSILAACAKLRRVGEL